MMLVSYDAEMGATYLELVDAPVARTVTVSDLVMVDVDAAGVPVGVEFAVAPGKITLAMVERVVERFPGLSAVLSDVDSWLLTTAH